MLYNFKTAKEIKRVDRSNSIIIKTGLKLIDETIQGLDLGQVSIVSGSNGSAKSTVLNQIALNVIEQGYGVGIFSGELSDWRLMNWLYLQCAGPKNVKKATNKAGEELNFYTVSDYNKDKIDEWLGDRLYIYDNDGGVGIDKVGNSIQELVKTDRRVKLIILDNLMSMNIQKYGADKYEAQKETILRLCQFAKKNNIHIIFVCHPTKVKDFIRKEDISGSADLSNAVDNVFICHRNTQDFKKRSKEFFGWTDDHPIYQYDNIIEIAKNRELGCIETLCGFYFDVTCKRFLNYKEECHKYGWEQGYKQQNIGELEEIDDDSLPF